MEDSPDSVPFYTYHPREPLSKERVESFSDGVYAIVATLLILDIWFVSLQSNFVITGSNRPLVVQLLCNNKEFALCFSSF